MFHSKRRWCVGSVSSAEELAKKLTSRTWTLCTGFYVEGHSEYLFLNDATSEDGAGEFAVVKAGIGAAEHRQIESITFSWCDHTTALRYIEEALAGAMDGNDFARPVTPRLETPEQHRCGYCA